MKNLSQQSFLAAVAVTTFLGTAVLLLIASVCLLVAYFYGLKNGTEDVRFAMESGATLIFGAIFMAFGMAME